MVKRKKFDKAFKEQVVLRIMSEETTISQMAEELGTHLKPGMRPKKSVLGTVNLICQE